MAPSGRASFSSRCRTTLWSVVRSRYRQTLQWRARRISGRFLQRPVPVSGGAPWASQVPGEPQCVHALLFDPGEMVSARPTQHHHAAFRRLEIVGSRGAVISGLNHTACTLAVYASQRRLPVHHARLASGRWPTFTGWDFNPLGSSRNFRATSCCSFQATRLSWRTET